MRQYNCKSQIDKRNRIFMITEYCNKEINYETIDYKENLEILQNKKYEIIRLFKC